MTLSACAGAVPGCIVPGQSPCSEQGSAQGGSRTPFWDVEPKSWWADLTWNPKLLQALVRLGKLHKYTSCGLWSCWKALFENINLLLFVSELLFSLLSSFGVFQKPALRERTFSCLEKNKPKRGNFWFITFSRQQKPHIKHPLMRPGSWCHPCSTEGEMVLSELKESSKEKRLWSQLRV